MRFHVMTLFPEMVSACLCAGILGKGEAKGAISFNVVNIRDYTAERKHLKVDDYTYGGGAGLLPQPGAAHRHGVRRQGLPALQFGQLRAGCAALRPGAGGGGDPDKLPCAAAFDEYFILLL